MMGRDRRAGHQAPVIAVMGLAGLAFLAACAPAGQPSAHSGQRRVAAVRPQAVPALQPLPDGPGTSLLLNTGVRQGARHAGIIGRIPAQARPYQIYAVCQGPGTITVATTSAGTFSQPCSNTGQGLDLNLAAEYLMPQTIVVTMSQKASWHVIAVIGQ